MTKPAQRVDGEDNEIIYFCCLMTTTDLVGSLLHSKQVTSPTLLVIDLDLDRHLGRGPDIGDRGRSSFNCK
jgi:hypothetical protein